MVRYLKQKRGAKKVLIAAFTFLVITLALFFTYWFQSYNPGKLAISAPFGLGSYEFDRATITDKELDLAWKLYVQLNTRKAAIPIDEQDDIIIEIYDSWYQLFSSTREYLIEMPAKDLEGNENAQQIVGLSLDVLNRGLRPHLTKWQGKYRKWYEDALKQEDNLKLSPQEVQRKYSHYEELMTDIKRVNKELEKYAGELKKFSHEKPPSFSTRATAWFKNMIGVFQ